MTACTTSKLPCCAAQVRTFFLRPSSLVTWFNEQPHLASEADATHIAIFPRDAWQDEACSEPLSGPEQGAEPA